jgi:Raf kinase inhibitor-like YbhB/YbcL family protein
MTRAAAFLALPFALLFAGVFACTEKTTIVNEAPAEAGTSSSGGESDAGGGTEEPAEPVPFALTSSAFAEGDALPVKYSCKGTNVSPPLEWTKGPEGTKSYTIVFIDTDNGLTHSAIYDIPADTTSLPEKVENAYEPSNVPGAKQPKSYKPTVFGYAGPCPNAEHTYEWTIYAIDVDALPDTSETTTKEQVTTLAKAHDLATAKLSVKFAP